MSATTPGPHYIPGQVPVMLTFMFIYLKLTEEIDWSWWWVLSPWLVLATLRVIVDVALWAEKRLQAKIDEYESEIEYAAGPDEAMDWDGFQRRNPEVSR